MKPFHTLRAACIGILTIASTVIAGEHVGLTAASPSPIVHFEASEYTAGTTSWTNKGTGGGSGTTATNGMSKTNSGVAGVVFAGKEVSNSNRVTGSIGSTTSVTRVTVEMWVRMKDKGNAQNAFGSMLFSWSGSPHYNIYHYEHGVGFNTINSEIYGLNASSYVNEWKHMTFIMAKNGTAADQKIYVNGILQPVSCNPVGNLASSCDSSSVINGRTFNSSGNFILMDNGYSSNTWNAKADVGMVRIYDTELSQAEITAAFDATKTNGYLDTVAPAVSSVSTPATPSASRNLSYTYTFSESISGLAGSDFTRTGTATGCVVTPAATTGTVIQVDVACTSDGTVVLSLDANSVTDAALNTGPVASHSASTITISVPVAPTTTSTTSSTTSSTTTSTTAPAATTTTVAVTSTTASPIATTTTLAAQTQTTVATTASLSTVVASPSQTPISQNSGLSKITTTTVRAKVLTPVSTTVPVTTTLPRTTTTVLASTTTSSSSTVPALSKISVPEFTDGKSVVEVNGAPVDVQISRRDNQLQILAESFTARLRIVKRGGGVSSLNSDGAISGLGGDSVNAEFEGLRPGSTVEVRMYSEPVLLGRTRVSPDGTVSASYEIPAAMESGSHSLAVLAVDAAGAPISFFSPMQVMGSGDGPGLVALLIAVPVLAAMGAGLFLPPVLRRRRRLV